MKRIEVDYILDGSVELDEFQAEGRVSFKILPDGRAYLRFDGHRISYRCAERIREMPADHDRAEDAR